MYPGIYTIEVTNSNGCTGIYTDVYVGTTGLPAFDCETAANNSLVPELYSNSADGQSNQEGTPIQITNTNGLTNIVVSPSTYQGEVVGTAWQHTYDVTFDLPPGYEPGVFTNAPGFFQIVNGVGRVTCQRNVYTSPPAGYYLTTSTTTTTTTSSGGGKDVIQPR